MSFDRRAECFVAWGIKYGVGGCSLGTDLYQTLWPSFNTVNSNLAETVLNGLTDLGLQSPAIDYANFIVISGGIALEIF